MNCIVCGSAFLVNDYLYNNSKTCKKCIKHNYINVVKEFEMLIKGGE